MAVPAWGIPIPTEIDSQEARRLLGGRLEPRCVNMPRHVCYHLKRGRKLQIEVGTLTENGQT